MDACNPNNNCRELRQDMLKNIMCYKFAVNDLALYLDTHPNDQKEYCKSLKELTDKYQKIYGPLTIEFPCNKWRWLEEPWPWERGMY